MDCSPADAWPLGRKRSQSEAILPVGASVSRVWIRLCFQLLWAYENNLETAISLLFLILFLRPLAVRGYAQESQIASIHPIKYLR